MTLRRRATVYVGVHEGVPSSGVCEAGSQEAPKPRLLDRMREALRLRRYGSSAVGFESRTWIWRQIRSSSAEVRATRTA